MTTLTRDRESVWDYPRPPRLERVPERIRVVVGAVALADSLRAWRVLETSHPPTYYVPPDDVLLEYLVPSPTRSACEWKGMASYHTLVLGSRRTEDVAWSYADPRPGFEPIRGHLAFYPGRVDEAWVGDERAKPQAGDFYGGWVTSWIEGPFKGGPGTLGW
jgi:uncharacterized protein (DUF427 family)